MKLSSLKENVPLSSRPKKGYQAIADLTAVFLLDPSEIQKLAESGLMFICDGFAKGKLIIRPIYRSRQDVETELDRAGFDFEFLQN